MSTDKPTPKKHIDGARIREHIFRELGVDVDALRHDQTAARPSQPSMAAGKAPMRPSAGYKQPPTQTRFVKGKSGNPRGRPKGSGTVKGAGKDKRALSPSLPILDEIRRRNLEAPIKVRDGEGTTELHIVEALLRRLNKLAFAGGIQAMRLALQWHEDTMRGLEAEYQDNVTWVADYRADFPERVAAYENAEEAVPDWIARPEDIHLSREKGLRIIGPYTPEALEAHLLIKRWRDAMQLKMIYDNIVFFGEPGARSTFTMAEFFVNWLDHLMPTRWKLDSKEARDREAMFLWDSRARQRQKLDDAFKAIGFKAPLKAPMPPVPDRVLRALGLNPKHIKARFAALETRSKAVS